MKNQKKINRTFNDLNHDELATVNGGSKTDTLGPIKSDGIKKLFDRIRDAFGR